MMKKNLTGKLGYKNEHPRKKCSEKVGVKRFKSKTGEENRKKSSVKIQGWEFSLLE